MKKFSIAVISSLLLFSFPQFSSAHPGRTDSSGCHTCRTNCSSWGLSTGEYHCHNAKQPTQPKEPIKSHYGEGGTGYTTSAPEYKYNGTPTPAPTPIKSEPTKEIKETPTEAKTQEKTTTAKDKDESSGAGILVLGAAGVWLYSKFKK